MTGLSVSPFSNGGGSIAPGTLIHQIPGGGPASASLALADNLADSQGQLYVTEFNSMAPGGNILADLVGRKQLLLEVGLAITNGDALYLSATAPGRATNVPPSIAIGVGTVLDASTYAGTGMVVATVGYTLLPPGVIAAGALITRSADGRSLVGADRTFVLSRALAYNYADLLLTGGFGGLWGIAGPINLGNSDGNAFEYGNGFATRNVRISVYISNNTLNPSGGSAALSFQITRNGSLVPGAIVAIPPGAGHTGVFDSGAVAIIGSIAATDTYGMFPTGFFPNGGTFTGSVTVQCYQ